MRCRGACLALIGVHPFARYRASSGWIPLYFVCFPRNFDLTVSWSHHETSLGLLLLPRTRSTTTRNALCRENVARRMAHHPPPNYRGLEARVECKREYLRGVRGSCRHPTQPWRNRRLPAQHAPRCSATRQRSAPREGTTSTRARTWRGQWSCPRSERVRISVTWPHPEFRNLPGN